VNVDAYACMVIAYSSKKVTIMQSYLVIFVIWGTSSVFKDFILFCSKCSVFSNL